MLPIYTVVIQNAVSDDLLGTVTGLSQFFRSIGGTVGVASFGALMLSFYNGQLPLNLPARLPPSVMQALHHPLASQQLKAVIAQNLRLYGGSAADAANLSHLLIEHVRVCLVNSIDLVFQLYAVLLLCTTAVNLALTELPLRSVKSSILPEKCQKA